MGVFKRTYKTNKGTKTSKNWYCEYYINNERFCKTTGTANKSEAIKICLALKEEALGEINGDREYLFDEAIEGWYEEYLKTLEERKRKTHKLVRDSYKICVRTLFRVQNPIDGKLLFIGKNLNSINKSTLMEFIRIRRRNGASDSTIKKDFNCISSIFSYAILNDMCDSKPSIDIVKRTLKNSKPINRYLTEEEYDKLLLSSCDHLKPIVIFAVETGLRKEEFLSLRWKDVDLVNEKINVVDTKNGKDRIVPISQRAKEQLHKQLQNNINKSEYVFYKNDGSRFLDVKKAFNMACQRSGVKDFRIHDLRKTFGSWRLQGIRGKKLPLIEVSKLLGHSSLDITASTYAFLDELKIEL